MNAQDGEGLQRRLLEDNLTNEDKEEFLHAFRYQTNVSELEARLRGGHDFDDIVDAALVATREFYEADNVLLANTDINLQIAGSVVRELPRKGVKPFCGSEPLDLTNYPKFSEMIGLEQPVACSDLTGLFPSGSVEYELLRKANIVSFIAVPYRKRNTGFVAIVNPHRYTERIDFLQVLSYVVVSEINESNLMRLLKDDHRLKENLGKRDVYVKLLGAFEIHSPNGILTESDFNGSRDVRFLALLFLRPDRGYSAEELKDIMWEVDAAPTTYKKTIARVCSSVRDTMKQYFPDEDLILFENSLYQVSPSYHIRSDYDEVQALFKEERLKTDTAERIDILLDALKEYPGRLLPSQTDDPAFALKIIGFERDRLEETMRCLKLLYQAGRYYEMLEIGEEAFMQHHEEPDLAEWILKAYIALGQIRPAKQLLSMWRKLLPNKTQKAIDLEIKSVERGK